MVFQNLKVEKCKIKFHPSTYTKFEIFSTSGLEVRQRKITQSIQNE